MKEMMWDYFKDSFDQNRKRMIKKKMVKIRSEILKEFEDKSLTEYFLSINQAKVELDKFHLKLDSNGLNLYDYLDEEDLFVVNQQLTLFSKNLTSTVPELMDLNETSILQKIVNITKMISDDNKNAKELEQYMESKIFESKEDSQYFLVQNPYIDVSKDQVTTRNSLSKKSQLFLLSSLLLLLAL